MPSRRAFVEAAFAGLTLSATSSTSLAQGTPQPPRRSRILVFDVNETLLDLSSLEPHFVRVFKSRDVLREWFSTVLLYSNVATIAGPYSDFGAIGAAALDMTAAARGTKLASDDRAAILAGMRALAAFPDVRPGLERVREAGFRLVTLTNNAPAVVEQQLKSAGLRDLFERAFSVDAVKKFKPAPEPYRYVARELGVTTRELRMVAAHAWDIVGALQAGCAAAFIARPGKTLYPLGPKPDLVAADIRAAADLILTTDV